MTPIKLLLFGSPALEKDGQSVSLTHRRAQALLAYLAINRQAHSRDALATLLWPDQSPARSRTYLRQALAELRKSVGETYFVADRETIALNSDEVWWVDVEQFQTKVAAGKSCPHPEQTDLPDQESCAHCLGYFSDAASLYTTDFLAGFTLPDSPEFDEWQFFQTDALRQMLLTTLIQLVDGHSAQHDYPTAILYAQRWAALNPLNEKAHRQLMALYEANDQQAAALRQYQICTQLLQDELGTIPEPETQTLYDQIRTRRSVAAPLPQSSPPLPMISDHPKDDAATQTQRPKLDREAELILLDKVYSFWIEGLFKQSLKESNPIEIGLEMVPDAVDNPWQDVLPDAPQVNRSIPPGKPIIDLLEENERALLILGAPGSGKTILLLQLVQALYHRAIRNEDDPIPVIFHLSSWSNDDQPLAAQPLEAWLVHELNEKYLMPKRLSQRWIKAERLCILLDGLDEVSPSHQADCIAAINQFRQTHGLVPMAVCSRIEAYISLAVKLRFGNAVQLKQLTIDQVDRYLHRAGTNLEMMRMALRDDPILQEIAQSPLMLQVMQHTFDQPLDQTLQNDLSKPDHDHKQVWLQTIFETHISRRLSRLADASTYNFNQAHHWLAWLAQRMSEQNQTVFQIESMQPSWLTDRNQRFRYILTTRVLLGCFVGIVMWLLGLMGAQLGTDEHSNLSVLVANNWGLNIVWVDLCFSLLINMGLGLIPALLDFAYFENHNHQSREPRAMQRIDLQRKLLMGFLLGVTISIFLWLAGEQLSLLLLQVIATVLLFMLGEHFAFGQGYYDDIDTIETLKWSWTAARRGLILALVAGGVFSIILWQMLQLQLSAIQLYLLVTLPIIVVLVLLNGLTRDHLEATAWPNQAIWLSAKSALKGILLVGVIVGGFVTVVQLILNRQSIEIGPLFGLYVGLVSGLLAGSVLGGGNSINHLVLRIIHWQQGDTPYDFIPFLDEAARHILLFKVGGGYIFMHRLLQDHLSKSAAKQ